MILFFVAGLLDALLLWLLIGARGRWAIKAGCIVAVLAFNFAIYKIEDNGTGWPTPDPPPTHSIFVACAINEPTTIWMWLIPLHSPGVLDYHPADAEPRAYRLPYSDWLYSLCIQAAKLEGKGIIVPITYTGNGHGHGGSKGHGHGHGHGHGQGQGQDGSGNGQRQKGGSSASRGGDQHAMHIGNIAEANALPKKQ